MRPIRWLKIAGQQLLALFVSDWTQTAGIALILILGGVVIGLLHVRWFGFGMVALLAIHLIFTTTMESRKRARREVEPPA